MKNNDDYASGFVTQDVYGQLSVDGVLLADHVAAVGDLVTVKRQQPKQYINLTRSRSVALPTTLVLGDVVLDMGRSISTLMGVTAIIITIGLVLMFVLGPVAIALSIFTVMGYWFYDWLTARVRTPLMDKASGQLIEQALKFVRTYAAKHHLPMAHVPYCQPPEADHVPAYSANTIQPAGAFRHQIGGHVFNSRRSFNPEHLYVTLHDPRQRGYCYNVTTETTDYIGFFPRLALHAAIILSFAYTLQVTIGMGVFHPPVALVTVAIIFGLSLWLGRMAAEGAPQPGEIGDALRDYIERGGSLRLSDAAFEELVRGDPP